MQNQSKQTPRLQIAILDVKMQLLIQMQMHHEPSQYDHENSQQFEVLMEHCLSKEVDQYTVIVR